MRERDIIRLAAATVAAFSLNLALDSGISLAQGRNGTPTPTATKTPTPTSTRMPDVEGTKLVLTHTALIESLSDEQKKAEIKAKIADAQRKLDELRGTPRPTATASATPTLPPTPTEDPDFINLPRRGLNDLIQKGIEIGVQAELNRRASLTPVPSATSAAALERVSKEQEERGFPWGLAAVGGGVVAALGAAGVVLRRRFHH